MDAGITILLIRTLTIGTGEFHFPLAQIGANAAIDQETLGRSARLVKPDTVHEIRADCDRRSRRIDGIERVGRGDHDIGNAILPGNRAAKVPLGVIALGEDGECLPQLLFHMAEKADPFLLRNQEARFGKIATIDRTGDKIVEIQNTGRVSGNRIAFACNRQRSRRACSGTSVRAAMSPAIGGYEITISTQQGIVAGIFRSDNDIPAAPARPGDP